MQASEITSGRGKCGGMHERVSGACGAARGLKSQVQEADWSLGGSWPRPWQNHTWNSLVACPPPLRPGSSMPLPLPRSGKTMLCHLSSHPLAPGFENSETEGGPGPHGTGLYWGRGGRGWLQRFGFHGRCSPEIPALQRSSSHRRPLCRAHSCHFQGRCSSLFPSDSRG